MDDHDLKAVQLDISWHEKALVFLIACLLAFAALQLIRNSGWSIKKLDEEAKEMVKGGL